MQYWLQCTEIHGTGQDREYNGTFICWGIQHIRSYRVRGYKEILRDSFGQVQVKRAHTYLQLAARPTPAAQHHLADQHSYGRGFTLI